VPNVRKRFGRVKWLVSCIVAAVISALAWITFEDVSMTDPRSAASRAAAIVLCGVHTEQPNPHFVIEEIWKHPPSNNTLSVGTFLVFSQPHDTSLHTPERAVVFFRASLWPNHGGLRKYAVWYVEGDRVLSPGISISELKAMCVTPPAPN
jgi:hypothetical protein